MHTGSKVVIGIGLVLCLIGAVFIVWGGTSGSANLEQAGEFAVEDATSGSIELIDEDGQGELGVTFWVKGEYVDDDDDGYWDHCNATGSITVISHPEVNSWDDAQEYNGSFYFEVIKDRGCEADEENKELIRSADGFIKVGRACLGCYSGTFEFESENPVWVSYDDVALAALFEGLGEVAGGFLMGASFCCCGGVFLIVGIILAFTMKSPNPNTTASMAPIPGQQVGYQVPPMNQHPPNQGQF